ncbi:MAG: bifunctional diaminohydroxyphosphoribosylaminopyrimidine deaminase/5-amino-6-(5-phosphoribosylamino)uracil reductase RibD [Myxococcota bacterium]|jgi:diaminohydroxyphosphoribosylaminopyrimidine deaminase/5-amino-6-(5-phosphoribosylamino)uracil reductase|nr:bifunctional diaminohydroxyphosphoribosylaminopyrimidine deaminase/5-amino-6-(5-phosphoribosylamino)uracil reductase RibD [Myxococcota bacterium]
MTSHRNAEHMREALALARRSRPSPNPRVGAVVVQEEEIVGVGYHERPGMPHAEIIALREAKERANGADLYVTLEPCCHVGRTGPCTDAIAKAGIRRVFVGMQDPDPRVNGNGLACLVAHGIEVHCNVEQQLCEALLAGYSHHRRTGRPLVTLKAAVTLDGYLATGNRQSQWISSEPSRTRTHEMRAHNDAVLVGIETVLADDPMLTVRLATGESPMRVVLDSRLRIPTTSKLVQSAAQTPLLVAHTHEAPRERIALLCALGVKLLACPSDEMGRLDLAILLDELGRAGVLSLLVEGGATIHGALLRHGLAQCLALFVAPRVLGSGLPWASFEGAQSIADATALHEMTCQPVGCDLLIEGRFT